MPLTIDQPRRSITSCPAPAYSGRTRRASEKQQECRTSNRMDGCISGLTTPIHRWFYYRPISARRASPPAFLGARRWRQDGKFDARSLPLLAHRVVRGGALIQPGIGGPADLRDFP